MSESTSASENDICREETPQETQQVSLCIRPPMKDGKIHVEGKIVGGTAVPLERFPYTVQFYNYGAMCAASILSSWSVLTAAHCFDYNKDANEMELHAGSRYTYDLAADVYEVSYFILHEDYNKTLPFACDIALIFVNRPITFSNKTSKALLVNTDKWMKMKDANFTATGWGWTRYGGSISKFGLMMTNLQFVSSARCSRLHNIRLSQDMFCLYGDGVRDTCRGDSGGGIEWNGMIVGVVSHGDGCAKKDKPSVYSNVWYFRKWIDDQLRTFLETYCKNNPNYNHLTEDIKHLAFELAVKKLWLEHTELTKSPSCLNSVSGFFESHLRTRLLIYAKFG